MSGRPAAPRPATAADWHRSPGPARGRAPGRAPVRPGRWRPAGSPAACARPPRRGRRVPLGDRDQPVAGGIEGEVGEARAGHSVSRSGARPGRTA